MLALIDEFQRVGEIQRISAQGMARNLPVEDFAGDVRIVGRNLAPALFTRIRGYPDETDKFIAERFKLVNLHDFPADRT